MTSPTNRNGDRLLRIVLAVSTTAMILIAARGQAGAQGLKVPEPGGLKAISATLAIKSPATSACPLKATLAGWINTINPGVVSYMIVRKGGSVAGPYQLETVPTAQGATGSFSREIDIETTINAQYRILVADGSGKIVSNWAPLKAECSTGLGG